MNTEVLERARHLSALGAALEQVREGGRGRRVLVGGEAGVGKTALLRRFCDEHAGDAGVLWGACDPLFTPRPLGPFFDMGGELEELVGESARPHEVVGALLRELQGSRPKILVLEDLHWADEATLDVLRLLARRIETVPALLIASYRDDELGADDSLRIVLGELQAERVHVPPLSETAVAQLAGSGHVDAEDLYRTTGGNPFYVQEVLAAGGVRIPPTVRDAVLARAARLNPRARPTLEAIAIEPQGAEAWLLEKLGADAGLDECLRSGIVTAAPRGVSFRHELARLAIEADLAPNRRLALHRAALAALEGASEDARLAHHAEAAGDAQAVLRHAPAAAQRASALGAHREAAAQYARALLFSEGRPPDERAWLLQARAYECYLSDELDQAIEAQEAALDARRDAGDPRAEGDSLRRLAQMYGFAGRTKEAAETCHRAVALLEPLGPGPELALAYGKLAQRYGNWDDSAAAIEWGTRALELAERLGDTEILVYALVSVGAAEFRTGGKREGVAKLARALELAREAGLEDHAGRAYTNLVWLAVRERAFDMAERYVDAGLGYTRERGLDYWELALSACRARSLLDQGRWAEASETAAEVLRHPRTAPVPRVLAGTVQSLVRARRGHPDVWRSLGAALELAEPTEEVQQVVPVAAARAEAAWLEGRHEDAVAATELAFELALRHGSEWEAGELDCWRRRAGLDEDAAPFAAEPFALELAGDCEGAAARWDELGCPYEAALALAGAEDDDSLRSSLDRLQRLGAQPAAAIVARRLRERGVRNLPRGPRLTTRQNPAQLTARELEVLALLADGMRNSQIAERLFLSEKTVGHHVSAILRKLDVHSRGEASAEAARLGLIER